MIPMGEVDWRVPWNEILREWLVENGLSIHDLGERLQIKWADAHRLAYDDVPMTDDLAEKLAMLTGIRAIFWTRLDTIYRTPITT